MKQKISNFFKMCRYKMKESVKWHRDYFFLKHSMRFHRNVRIVFSAFKTAILVFSFIYIVFSSKMVLLTGKHMPFLNEAFTTEYISISGILGTQITLTLICVSLIALISNIENKHVYGERILELAFPLKCLSFKVVLFVLFGLLLLSLYVMLNNSPLVYAILILLLTIYFAIFVLYRFAMIFLNRKSLEKALVYKYYKSNLVHMKKARPIEPHISEFMRKLKVVTLKHISNKNYPELNEYMLLYFNLLKITLFNKPKQVQEYYTEHMNFQDIIGHINEYALTMLHEDKALYGLQIYNALLRHINYYKIVCVQGVSFTSDSFIDALSDLKDITQIKRYLNELLYMASLLMQQTYLYSTVDFSYCRLAKPENMIYYFAKRSMYEKIYDLIIRSENLSNDEKDDLIETIRLNIISFTSHSTEQDVDDFKKKERFHKEGRIYDLEIKSEPIALLFIRFIEKNDIIHLIYYSYAWNTFDKKDRAINFALLLTSLSVINSLHKKGQKEYVHDIDIDPQNVKALFKKCGILNIKISEEILKEFYSIVIQKYITNNQGEDQHKKLYSFHPKLSFDQEVVDVLFAYLYWHSNNEGTIQEMATKYNLLYTKDIEDTILSLCVEDNEDKN